MALTRSFNHGLVCSPQVFLDSHHKLLRALFDTYVEGALQLLRRNFAEPVPTVNNNLLNSLLKLMDCFLAYYKGEDDDDDEGKLSEKELAEVANHIEGYFIFSLVWSCCCTVGATERTHFDGWLRGTMRSHKSMVEFPSNGLVYDYVYDASKGWVKWLDTIDKYEYNPQLSFADTIVPTSDSVCYTFLLDTLIRNEKHVLMTGPTGTGKTVNIQKHLSSGMSNVYIPLGITFSAQTSANQTQDLLDSKMDKRRKGVFGPPSGKKFVVFIDDFNMPQREEYFAQPPIELVRQWFTYGGWYDRKTLAFRNIIDIIMVAAMGPPGGGRNPVTPRILRHYNIIGYTALNQSSMEVIFDSILSGNFGAKFENKISNLANPLVKATIEVYDTILADLLPTPAKSHYTFNLRDLGKVFQGILMIHPKYLSDAEPGALLQLWVHECGRVFRDRLVNDEDRVWFDNLLMDQMKKHTGVDWDKVKPEDDFLCFGDLMDPDSKQYTRIESGAGLLKAMENSLEDFNADTKTPMNLKLFMDAVGHISKISRVIRQPMGNALLLGVGGSGRKSLSRLATYVADFGLYTVEIAKGYGLTEWRENVKECLMLAGVDNKPTVFLFDDTQIVFTQMLEDVNGILNSGDVPNLYAPEDMEKIMNSCRQDCLKKKVQPTKLNIFAAYVSRVRKNIHVVFCMSPGTAIFRDRLRMFPSLVNCCTIDWFSEWPDEALTSVGKGTLLSGQDLKLGGSIDNVVSLFKLFHQSVAEISKEYFEVLRRYNYVTPTSYLELLTTFKTLLLKKREEVEKKRDRIQVGLDKLISTADQVADLQVQLTEMQPVLASTQKEVEEMIVQITKDKAAANQTKETVEKEEAAAKIKADETEAIKRDAQADLDEALPALDEAVKCLNMLKKADIDEVKSLKTPPSGVKLTMEAACIMFGIKPAKINDPNNMGKKILDYWGTSKKELLNDAKLLLQRLFNFDKDNIPQKNIDKVQPLIDSPDFTPKAIEKASKACTAICMWVRAMHKYHYVALSVEPKRKRA